MLLSISLYSIREGFIKFVLKLKVLITIQYSELCTLIMLVEYDICFCPACSNPNVKKNKITYLACPWNRSKIN